MVNTPYTSSEVPGQNRITECTLEVLHDLGGSVSTDEIRKQVIRRLDLSIALTEVTFVGNSRTNVLDYRLREARTRLKKRGLISNPNHGQWAVMQRGWHEENLRPASGHENRRLTSENFGILSQAVELNHSGITKIDDYCGNLSGFLEAYNYQPGLTPKLDGLGDSPLDQEIINEIVLWKTNRYARLNAEDIHSLNELVHLRIENEVTSIGV